MSKPSVQLKPAQKVKSRSASGVTKKKTASARLPRRIKYLEKAEVKKFWARMSRMPKEVYLTNRSRGLALASRKRKGIYSEFAGVFSNAIPLSEFMSEIEHAAKDFAR